MYRLCVAVVATVLSACATVAPAPMPPVPIVAMPDEPEEEPEIPTDQLCSSKMFIEYLADSRKQIENHFEGAKVDITVLTCTAYPLHFFAMYEVAISKNNMTYRVVRLMTMDKDGIEDDPVAGHSIRSLTRFMVKPPKENSDENTL